MADQPRARTAFHPMGPWASSPRHGLRRLRRRRCRAPHRRPGGARLAIGILTVNLMATSRTGPWDNDSRAIVGVPMVAVGGLPVQETVRTASPLSRHLHLGRGARDPISRWRVAMNSSLLTSTSSRTPPYSIAVGTLRPPRSRWASSRTKRIARSILVNHHERPVGVAAVRHRLSVRGRARSTAESGGKLAVTSRTTLPWT